MIYVVGIGPGDRALMTREAQDVINRADWLVGWPRALALFPEFAGQIRKMDVDIDGLLSWLKQSQGQTIVILASGDPLLFGVGKRICEVFPPEMCRIINGISSVQYLFGRIGKDMNDVFITSSHGKTPDYDLMMRLDKVAMVTDKVIGPYQIAQEIRRRGGTYSMIIGENLSYPEERIQYLTSTQLSDITEKEYGLTVVVLLNERQ